MLQEGLDEETIDEVCRIIAHHHTPGVVHTSHFEVVYDADLIVNLESRELSGGKFLTEGGRKLGQSRLPGHSEDPISSGPV